MMMHTLQYVTEMIGRINPALPKANNQPCLVPRNVGLQRIKSGPVNISQSQIAISPVCSAVYSNLGDTIPGSAITQGDISLAVAPSPHLTNVSLFLSKLTSVGLLVSGLSCSCLQTQTLPEPRNSRNTSCQHCYIINFNISRSLILHEEHPISF